MNKIKLNNQTYLTEKQMELEQTKFVQDFHKRVVSNYKAVCEQINVFFRQKTILDNITVLNHKTVISEAIFSKRTCQVIYNIMRKRDGITLYHLSLQSKYRFMKYPSCTPEVINEIDNVLNNIGLQMLN